MQRLLNQPENYVDEMLEGIYLAYPDQVEYINNDLCCYVTKEKKPGKVGIRERNVGRLLRWRSISIT